MPRQRPEEGDSVVQQHTSERTDGAQSSARAESRAPTFGGSDTQAGPRATHLPLRILVVEDTRVNQLLTEQMLEQFDYSAVVASDGLQALKAIESGEFDLILMDVKMPRMDGLETTRRIRAREAELKARRSWIVAVTASLPETRVAVVAAGMDEALGKPIQLDELEQTLNRIAVAVNKGRAS
jgi:CheY-like chemotaxis protein